MSKKWYISFHGGKDKAHGCECKHLNNIHIYSTDGEHKGKALNKSSSLDAGINLCELRGFTRGPDGNLYVVNAYWKYSEILKFNGELNDDGQHDFAGVFVTPHWKMNPGIKHPFNVAFDSNGDLYVSSQDTHLLLRYHGPASKQNQPGMPMPFPESLVLDAHPPPGTFVPSWDLTDTGLRGVREAIFAPNKELYVADPADNHVWRYEAPTGRCLGDLVSKKDLLNRPIHLLLSPDNRYLFIGLAGNDSVLRHDLHESVTSVFVASKSGGLDGPAGMAFGDDDGFLYVASRKTKKILRYDVNDGRLCDEPFIKDLPDQPEFLMLLETPEAQ